MIRGKNGWGKKWIDLKNIQAVLLGEKVTTEKMKYERIENKLWLKLCQAHVQFRLNSDLDR